ISTKSLFAGFASSFFTLGGFALMTPLWTLNAGKIVQRFAGSVAGIEGVLAGTYLQRAINRSSLVIAALMLSLAMSIGLSTMVGSFRAAVEDWVTATVSADIYITPANGFSGDAGPGLPTEVVPFARSLPQVQSSDVVRNLRLQINNQPVSVAANELPTLVQGRPPLRILQTIGGEEAARRDFVAGRAVLVSERFKNLVGPGAGDTLVLPSPSGTVRFPIAAVFSDYSPDACVVYLPRALYRKYWRDDNIDGIALYLKSDSSTRSVQEALQKRFAARYQLTILPNRELRDVIFTTFDQTFAVTYALQLIAIIVAAIGIFDTLIALLLERGRELATLRALGASAGQIRKMAYVEFALIGFIAWTIGVFAGLCLAWQLIYVINRQFFGWSIAWTFSTQTLIVALLASVAAAVVAGVWPSYAASRRVIADALQVE
ncbi:MAG TPA: ABC transporter permease, partial [Abditibacteriaceae bacterium]|nr:ABC transporter permease [Abditibacteriaceae bacterium]